ncbi:LpqB family beta-propeller domain-containing protein [Kineococcus sp. SYSU DK001]|uniref:LpqB family beta-propeller domain-containing protein n=1 Tax=Kineococcus sp. SYSU DK001 TaxID=3383122 RepID=UPI003D7DAB2C
MRTGRAAVPVLALALAVAGCGGIPRSGDVVAGSRVEADPRVGLLQVIADGPVRGAGPVDVVRGFLLAAASSDDDHGVAREFLTAAAAQTWRADASTTIVTGAPDLALVSLDGSGDDAQAVVSLTSTTTAVIDAAGHYVERAPGPPTTRQVRLVREDGQWRLADPGDGIVLTSLDASRTVRSFPVYFVTAGPSPQLVADVRWFGYDSSTATRIVRALLEGPSPWLAPGVVSGAPRGTSLRVGTVPVAAGTATVDLSDTALEADPAQRSTLLAQLRASLTGLPGLSDVTVSVDGAELTRDGSRGADLPRSAVPADARLVVLGPEGLSRWDRQALRPVAGTGPGLASTEGAAHPAAAPDGTTYAVLTDEGRVARVQTAGGPLQPAVSGRGPLLPPAVDRFGWLWTAATATGQPLVVPVGAPATPAEVVEPPAGGFGGTLTGLRVSRDGARVLVVVRGDDGSGAGGWHVRVHGVVRDGAGRPLRLGEPGADLAPGAGEVLDAAWLVEDRFALLVRRADGSTVPVLAEVSGPSAPLPAVPGAVSVAGGWSDRDLVVGTADGRLLTRSGADWIVVADGRDPSYPG